MSGSGYERDTATGNPGAVEAVERFTAEFARARDLDEARWRAGEFLEPSPARRLLLYAALTVAIIDLERGGTAVALGMLTEIRDSLPAPLGKGEVSR